MSNALDTNVLVRLATRDDAAQFRKAEKLVRDSFSQSVPAWISVIVVVDKGVTTTQWTVCSIEF